MSQLIPPYEFHRLRSRVHSVSSLLLRQTNDLVCAFSAANKWVDSDRLSLLLGNTVKLSRWDTQKA